MKRKAATAVVLSAFTWQAQALGEVEIVEKDGWGVSTDGRVNAFISVARGTGIPDNQPDQPAGISTRDTKDSDDQLRSTRIRNGFLSSILGFNVKKQVLPDLKVTGRAALWMNTSGTRTKASPGAVDPQELYGKLEGSWGSLLGGSSLALFGRGGILVDSDIAHEYGMGYPCSIESGAGGACGMAAFGAVFPGFEPGFVYTTPELGGLQLSLGVYDPANVANAELNRSPLPRLEAEAAFALPEIFKVFANGFWQRLEGSRPVDGVRTDIKATAWGGQGGLMLTLGPVMVGGAGFMGQAITPITYIQESTITFDSESIPRKSRGGFGLGAVKIDAINLKVAGGAGVFLMDKTENDPEAVSATGLVGNPRLLKQNFGMTAGVYQTTGPLHFALEYFRAEHTFYDYGETDPNDPTIVTINKPVQVVNFINAGFTFVW